jgi:hypothetical protein
MSINLELATMVDETLAELLTGPVERTQDALIVHLNNGVSITVHYAESEAYSMRWTANGQQAGIDTAPLHRDLPTFPNHMHDSAGQLRPDPITSPSRPPAENLRRLITALIDNPTLGSTHTP